jgi:hypothetical protein
MQVLRSARRPLLVAALGLAAACDVPTSAPKWDTSWQVPVSEDSVTIGQLLPGGVSSTGVLFNVAVQRDSVVTSLGAMCGGPCAAKHGTTDSLPAFSFTLFVEDSVPQNVVLVTPAPGSTYSYQVKNDLSFDPLRPQGGVFGTLIVGLVDPDSNVIAVDTVRGQTVTVAPGTVLSRTMAMTSAGVKGPFQLAARVIVPAGAVVPIDTLSSITIRSTQDSVGLSSVRVVVDSLSIVSLSKDVDLTGLVGEFESSIQAAEVKITIQNPMSIGGAVQLNFQDGLGADIIPPKAFTLAPGSTVQTIGLTQAGILDLIEYGTVHLRITGVVAGTLGASVAEIHPDDVAELKSRIFVTVRVGED